MSRPGRRRARVTAPAPRRLDPQPSPTGMWTGLDLLLVDGNNLLHRTAGGPGVGAARLLVGHLRARLPDGIACIVVLDGPPDPGAPARERFDAHLEVRHAGPRDADSAIVELVHQRLPRERGGLVVVTDDRALTQRVRTSGGLTRRVDWLVAFLDRPPRPAGRPAGPPAVTTVARPAAPRRTPRSSPGPAAAAPDAPRAEEDGHDPWRPGRGATRKRGPSRRAPRRG